MRAESRGDRADGTRTPCTTESSFLTDSAIRPTARHRQVRSNSESVRGHKHLAIRLAGCSFAGCRAMIAYAALTASEQFAALLDDAWEFDLREDPLFATETGDHRYDDQLPKVSLADSKRRASGAARDLSSGSKPSTAANSRPAIR